MNKCEVVMKQRLQGGVFKLCKLLGFLPQLVPESIPAS